MNQSKMTIPNAKKGAESATNKSILKMTIFYSNTANAKVQSKTFTVNVSSRSLKRFSKALKNKMNSSKHNVASAITLLY